LRKATWLYKVLLVGSFLGFIFPVLSLFSRLSANEGEYLGKLIESVGYENLLDWIIYFPSWHYGEDIGFPYNLYLRWSAYAMISLLILFFFRKKISPLVNKIESYLIGNKKIYIFVLFAVFIFQSKFFAGWWFHGIGGWDFSKYKSKINLGSQDPVKYPQYLDSAVHWENFDLLSCTQKKPYTISGKALIAFTETNCTIPINLGLLEIVFPNRFMKNPQTLIKLINHKIPMIKDYQSLYPEHTPYARLDYADFNGSKITKVEFWDLNLSSDGFVNFISSAKINEIFYQ
jgi:hypothetical protein